MTAPGRVAALYDIHGNLPALAAVLAEVEREGVDLVVVGGDVLPGPMPRECLDRLLTLRSPVECIYGNGEVAILDEAAGREPRVPAQFRDGIRWNAAQLDRAQPGWLGHWPKTFQVMVVGIGQVLFCHGTPRDENEIFTRMTPDESVQAMFEAVDAALVVCGHTHMQFDRTVGRVRMVNAGSVGMPFGEPGAYWLLLGPGVELRRAGYDFEAAAAQIRLTNYPGAEQFASNNVLNPPSEEQMLKMMSATEAK
jgi:putative phosphoesterase